MKKIISFSLAVCGCLLLSAQVFTFSPSGPAVAFQRDQTHGNIRVVLLKVEHATLFSSKHVRDAKPEDFYPVQTLAVTYMIEALGNDPIKNWYSEDSKSQMTLGNIPVGEDRALPPNVLPFTYLGSPRPISSYTNGPEELPTSFNAKRAVIQEFRFPVQPGQLGRLILNLNLGFNDQKETFVFRDIPLD